jgi:hypothetical protein
MTRSTALCVLALAGAASPAIAQLAGNAQLTSTPAAGGQFNNAIVVHDTGTTTIGTFWYSWIPGENFMPSMPTNITSPTGWNAQVYVFGGPTYSIEWYTYDPSAYVPAGGQLSGFGYTGTMDAAALQQPAGNDLRYYITDSYFYQTQAFSDPGLLFRVGVVTGGSHCGSADFNCDGDIGTDGDIEAFFACLSGTCPAAPCASNADFNADGDVGTDADIESFFRVLAGGPC